MPLLENIIDVGGLSAQVYRITGDRGDAAAAAGYGAWVNSITGEYPTVVQTPEGQAQVVLTERQAVDMRGWLDKQIWQSIVPKEPGRLQIEFKPVVGPLAVRYLLIIGAGAFLAGWLSRGIVR